MYCIQTSLTFALWFHFPVVNWKSEGCYNEERRPQLKILPNKFASVYGLKIQNPIEKVYNNCKAKAESSGYEIFAIRVRIICCSLFLFVSLAQWGSSEISNNFQLTGISRESKSIILKFSLNGNFQSFLS